MKKQLISIAKSITVFILLIFCAVVIDARAEDYLWEPTLAWEDPSPGIGHKLLNNDEWLIYYADNKVQLRELATGKKLAESEDLLQLLELTKCDAASFSMSNDGEKIYGIFTYYNVGPMVIFDSKTLKVIKIIKFKSIGGFAPYTFGKDKFKIGSIEIGYTVSENDFRLILNTHYDYEGNYPKPGEPIKPDGVCIISFNPNSTDELDLRNKDSYKMLFYNESGFGEMGVFRKYNKTHLLDMITMKSILSFDGQMFLSKNRKYALLNAKGILQVVDVDSKETLRNYSLSELNNAGWKNGRITLYGSNIDRIFKNFEIYFYNGFYCFDYYMKKSTPMFSEKMNKHLFTKLVQIGEAYTLADDNLNYLIVRGMKDLSVYKLFERSSVKENTVKGIIVDSVNANIPIPDGKYPYYISIYSSDGKLVEEVKDLEIDNNQIIYNIENLSNGIYIINIKYEDGSSQSFKFVKGK